MLSKILRDTPRQLKRIGRAIRKHKSAARAIVIFVLVVMVCCIVDEFAMQNTLYQNKTPIVVEWSDPAVKTGRIDLSQLKSEYNTTAVISGISPLASVMINGKEETVSDYSNKFGRITIKAKDLHEGDNKYTIQIIDGKRKIEKTIVIHRQTKAEVDKKKAEEEEKKRRIEEQRKAEEERRQAEERARQEQASRKAAEEASRNAVAQRQTQVHQYQQPVQNHQVQSPQQPQVYCPKSCKEARLMGMHDIPRGHQCYSNRLDADHDGFACDEKEK